MVKHRLFCVKSPLRSILLKFFVVAGAGIANAGAEVRVMDAHARESLPGAANSAAYMQIVNDTDVEQVIVAAESPRIPRILIHEQAIEQGMASMSAVERVVVKPRSEFQFKPGATHFMLMGVARPLRAGEVIPFTLVFDDGNRQQLEMTVRSLFPGNPNK